MLQNGCIVTNIDILAQPAPLMSNKHIADKPKGQQLSAWSAADRSFTGRINPRAGVSRESANHLSPARTHDGFFKLKFSTTRPNSRAVQGEEFEEYKLSIFKILKDARLSLKMIQLHLSS
jgi:hypothetical protein